MNPSEIKVVPVCICSLCCIGLVFAVIALPLSFKSLEQGKYALELNWHNQQIGDTTFTEPGMYWLGLGNMLVEFPSTFQTMYFIADNRGTASSDEDDEHPSIKRGPLRARSADGLEMLVSLSFQWQLEQTALKPLYYILGGGTIEESLYRDEFVRFARAAIVESCSQYTADYFFTNRKDITADMLAKTIAAFDQPTKGMRIKITGLQLREVDVPDAFDAEIIRTQEQMQEVEVALAEREEQKIIETKKLMVAEEQVNRVYQEALGNAAKTLIINDAIVKQKLYYQLKQAQANANILAKFWNSTDPFARMFEMMEIHALNKHNDNRLLINL